MRLIPLQATPNQDRSVQLGGVNYKLRLRALDIDGTQQMFLSLAQAAATSDMIDSALCRDRVRIVRDEYIGFNGDLVFFDTQGTNDPQWQELGTRYVLAWLEPGEVVA